MIEGSLGVDIELVNGSAKGKFGKSLHTIPDIALFTVEGEDYGASPSSQSVVFTTDQTRHCINITINNDSTVESNEFFSVVLSSPEERVILNPKSADIVIKDNDSKYQIN